MQRTNRLVVMLVIILMMFIMAGATVATLSGMARHERVRHQEMWAVGADNSESVNVTDVTGDGVRDIFVHDRSGVYILDEAGEVLVARAFAETAGTTQGDVDGDGLPDMIVYTGRRDTAQVTVFNGQNELLWSQEIENLGVPGRALALDFENDGRHEVVLADLDNGRLLALSADGALLWRYQLQGGGSLRGLDEIGLTAGDYVAAGLDSGEVIILDRQGRLVWSDYVAGGLRRLRSFPLGGPLAGHLFIGSNSGELRVHQGDDGQALVWSTFVGQAVNEIRPVEVDGNPATTEIGVGGKDGGVWVFSQTGELLWSAVAGDKVSEVMGLQLPQFKKPMVMIGTESGSVLLYDQEGWQLHRFTLPSGINRLDTGDFGATQGFLVADANQLAYFTLTTETAPFWYTPLLMGVMACLLLAGTIYYLSSRLEPTPMLYVTAQESGVSAQLARRRMLHESIGDLQKMQGEGEIRGEAYLARMRALRGQLAAVNEALIDAGEAVTMETFLCPHCNGPLALGTDKCEYCGQVTIV